ncbi:MAG: FG-GAP repeat protein [Planctomycetes bacterium]|nr:FG-GAP repeat protein [Planctomycetota bacterium]
MPRLPLTALLASGLAHLASGQSHFSLDGSASENFLGASTANVGDVNLDGYSDLLVGEPGSDSNGLDSGRALLVSGKNGFILRTHSGESILRRFGSKVSAAGDHNGDGRLDYAVSATFDNEFSYPSGKVVVYSGVDGSLIREYSSAANWDYFGSATCNVGDLNGDGFDELAVGAHDDDWAGLGSGSVFIFSGADGSAIHTFRGGHPWDRFGFSVIGCGDMDFDGVPDFAIGAPNQKAGAKSAGKVYFYSGASGQSILSIRGRDKDSFFGTTMVCLQDVNGDAIADVAIAGIDDSTNIVGLHSYIQICSGADGSVIRTLEQEMDGERFGYSMAAMDLNGDSYLDLVAGSPMAGQLGSTGLASGRIQGFSGPSGRLLFSQNGTQAYARMGSSLCSTDDLDGNGIDEIFVGSSGNGGGSLGGGKVETMAPPAFGRIVQPNLLSGANTQIELIDGTWYSTYYVYASLTGPGNASPDGNDVLDLAGPLLNIGQINTDPFGHGTLTAFVPNNMQGQQVWLQAWRPLGDGGVETLTTAVIQ